MTCNFVNAASDALAHGLFIFSLYKVLGLQFDFPTMQGFLFSLLIAGSVIAVASPAACGEVINLNEPIAPMVSAAPVTQAIRIDGESFAAAPSLTNPRLNQFIDESFALIYSTRAARETLLSAEMDRTEASIDTLFMWPFTSSRLEAALGVPFDVTSPILDANSAAYSDVKQDKGEIQEAVGRSELPRKRYFFLLKEPTPYVDSFTVEGNTTLIFVQPEQTTRLTLLKILSHEMAISGDQKRILPRDLYTELRSRLSHEDAIAKIPPILLNNDVTMLFQVVRAFAFERQVLTDLVPTIAHSLSREEAALYRTDLTNEKQCRAFAKEEAQRLIAIHHLPSAVLNELDVLWKTAPKMKVHGVSTPICVYASAPRVRALAFKTRGPRPRIGDTNGMKLPDLKIDLDARRALSKTRIPDLQVILNNRAGVKPTRLDAGETPFAPSAAAKGTP